MSSAIILGTRPEIIKMSPVIRECERRGMEYFILHTGHGNKATVIYQTGLTGSTGFVSSFDPVHPVILSKIKKPQMMAPRVTPLEGVYTYACGHTWVRSRESAGFRHDERRFIALFHRQGRKERKAQLHKSLYIEEIIRPGTRMTRIKRIYTDYHIRAINTELVRTETNSVIQSSEDKSK